MPSNKETPRDKTGRFLFRNAEFTEHSRDRDPGILTYADRAYLLGEKDVSGGSEVQLRQRMRDRVRNGLLDFELLLRYMDDRDIQTIFNNASSPSQRGESEPDNIYWGAESALGFIYHGISEHTHANFEQLVRSAVEYGSSRSKRARQGPHYSIAEASVDIELEWNHDIIDHEHTLEKLRSGAQLTDPELAALVRYGDLDPDDWTRLEQRNMAVSDAVSTGNEEE